MRLARRALLATASAGAAAALLVACSTSDVMRPEVDIQRTAAVTVPSPHLIAPADPYAGSGQDIDPGMEIQPEEPDFGQQSEPDDSQPDGQYSQPAKPGFEPAPDPQADAASPSDLEVRDLDQSDFVGTDEPAVADPEPQYAAPAVPRMSRSMPQDELDCRRQLRRIGATYRDLPTIRDGGSCGIDHPVELSRLSGGIAIKPAATLTCKMALTLARWTKNELGPATRLRYLTGVKTIHNASSYSCRRIAGSGTMSEHSKGNAIDISRIELDSGREIGVRKKGFFRFREKSLLNNVRGDACSYFSTVLGPGYNYDHRDHFHFDIAQRRKGRVACH